MGDSQQDRGKSQYIQWSPQESKTLINLLLDGVAQGWRDVNGVFSKFTVEGRILPALNQTHKGDKNHKHYVNRMKILKGKYLSGVEFLRFSSGFGWDPNTKRFTASNEVWDNYFMSAPPFPYETQAEIVLACAGLHNFLRKNCRSDIFLEESVEEVIEDTNDNDDEFLTTQDQQREYVNQWRATIATDMWTDSISHESHG